jgi:hypothetical protein
MCPREGSRRPDCPPRSAPASSQCRARVLPSESSPPSGRPPHSDHRRPEQSGEFDCRSLLCHRRAAKGVRSEMRHLMPARGHEQRESPSARQRYCPQMREHPTRHEHTQSTPSETPAGIESPYECGTPFIAVIRCVSVSHGREFGAKRVGPGRSSLVIPLGLVAPCQKDILRVRDALAAGVLRRSHGKPAGIARCVLPRTA